MIHFFGPDGSGKSTHVDLLVSRLRHEGLYVRKCWVRSPHTMAFVLWRLFVKIGFCRTVRNPFGIEIRLPAVDRSNLLRSFWALTEFFSVLPLIIKIDVGMKRGRKFVAERYLLDTVVTVAFFVNDPCFLGGRIARLLYLLLPKDTVFIFLDSSYETVYARRAHIYTEGYDPRGREYGMIPKSVVEPREFIDFQRVAYGALAKAFDAFKIDTSQWSVEETADKIWKHLE